MAAETGEELTHDEMWDDSDLVQNWNEAFAEYNVCNLLFSHTRLTARTNRRAEVPQPCGSRREGREVCYVERSRSKR